MRVKKMAAFSLRWELAREVNRHFLVNKYRDLSVLFSFLLFLTKLSQYRSISYNRHNYFVFLNFSLLGEGYLSGRGGHIVIALVSHIYIYI